MTLEERAKTIASRISPKHDNFAHIHEHWVKYILSALREAREEGIEEAAQLAKAQADQDRQKAREVEKEQPDTKANVKRYELYDDQALVAEDLAFAIRALKKGGK